MVLSVYILRWGMVVICSAYVHLDVTCGVSVHGGHTLLPCSMVRHASPFRISHKTPLHLPSAPSHPTNIHQYRSPGTERQSTTFSCLQPRLIPSTHSPISFNAHNSSFQPSPHLTLTSPPFDSDTLPHSFFQNSPPTLILPPSLLAPFSPTSPPSSPPPHHHLDRPTPHSAGATPGQ